MAEQQFDYDVLVEIYPASSAPQRPLPETVLQAFAADRTFFMDAQRTGGPVEESLAYGPPRTVDPVGLSKLCIPARGDGKALLALLMRAARREGIERITCDRFVEEDPDRPFGSLLWLWADTLSERFTAELAARKDVVAIIETRSHETTPDLLKALS